MNSHIGVTSFIYRGESRDVIGHVTIRFPMPAISYLVVLCNQSSISNGFRDIH